MKLGDYMIDKNDFYAMQILPMVEKITQLCEANQLPMLMAFCLDQAEAANGKLEMTLAGSHNLERGLQPPQPMLLAATILRVPGFGISVPLESAQVH